MEQTIIVNQRNFRNRFIEKFKILMESCHDTLLPSSVIFFIVNIYLALYNGGKVTNDFNHYGEMYFEAGMFAFLLGMTLGHRLVISKDRRKSLIFGGAMCVMVVCIIIVVTSGVMN